MASDEDYYWSWADQTDVRVSLTFVRPGQPLFTQQFLFRRRQV
ncbi:MAG TPA: hypothetical protein VMS17_28525 [Gemmataceae bacterium]|nr:hypothetical protein [Gemmataceae bacterium]